MMIVTIQRRGRAVRVNTENGHRVGDFRNEQVALEFTRRVLGDFQVQHEFSFTQSARGAGPGRKLTVSCDDSGQDRRALSLEPQPKDHHASKD